MANPNTNFVPSIRCPNCSKPLHAEVSGWGRSGLNVRFKTCRHCNSDYNVIIYVEAVKTDSVESDGYIAGLRDQLAYATKQRKTYVDLLRSNLSNELKIPDFVGAS